MQRYKCKKYTTIQAQGYVSTKLQNDVRIKTVTFQNMLLCSVQYKQFTVHISKSYY